MKSSLFRFWCVALLPGTLWAQRVQSMDISVMFGPWRVNAQTIPGTNVTLSGTHGHAFEANFGYQVLRRPTGSLLVEFMPLTSTSPGKIRGNGIAGSVDLSMSTFTPGVRYMVPLTSRFSVYGALGGGFGFFNRAGVQATTPPTVISGLTTHGVLDFGGGVDFRLIQWVSVRAEVRDYVTGAGLSGVPGPNHVVPVAGLVGHF